MHLTNEHLIDGKRASGVSDDLSYIVNFSWKTLVHMKEATKIMLIARLDSADSRPPRRFEGEGPPEQKEVRLSLAGNPRTSEEVLDYLRKTCDKDVCERIAVNPRSSATTLLALSLHRDPEVRALLSENPCCPVAVLYRFAGDEHPDVRLRLAENPSLPLSIIVELSEDENPFVSARARTTLTRLTGDNVIKADFSANAFTAGKMTLVK